MLELDKLRLIPDGPQLSRQFASGEITVVLGHNGSGKTRLARIIAGFEQAGGGRALLDGDDITVRSPGERSVALVYQEFVNYPGWTVAQNLASPLRAQGLSTALINERVARIARQLELTELLERYPEALSGGQQQRVAIGRALAKSARVLVLDEPLVNLDYKLRESLQVELRTLLHEFEMTVIYTTSDPRDVFALGDSVMLLAEHAQIQSGRPLEVYDRPGSALAADLMSEPFVNRLWQDGVLQIVRPEHLELVAHAKDDVPFPVKVIEVETNGSETYLHCEVAAVAGAALDADVHWVARLNGLLDAHPGEMRTLYVAAGAVMEFAEDV